MRSLNTPPTCALPRCEATARYRLRVCNRHWLMVPEAQRTAILDAWRQHDYATEKAMITGAVAQLVASRV